MQFIVSKLFFLTIFVNSEQFSNQDFLKRLSLFSYSKHYWNILEQNIMIIFLCTFNKDMWGFVHIKWSSSCTLKWLVANLSGKSTWEHSKIPKFFREILRTAFITFYQILFIFIWKTEFKFRFFLEYFAWKSSFQ